MSELTNSACAYCDTLAEIERLRECLERAEKPKIISAAVITADGVVHSLPPPARHHNIVHTHGDLDGMTQGFLSSTGLFLDRAAAFVVASDAGQVKRRDGGYRGDDLYSEDLW